MAKENPKTAPDVPAFPAKFVYTGELASYGPYRGFTPESVADDLGLTDEARKDFVANLKAW